MYHPVEWAKQSTDGRQSHASGSRLINFYAVAPAAPAGDKKTGVILYGSPGFEQWGTLPVALDASVNPQTELPAARQGVRALAAVESPLYGDFIVGITGEYTLFWHRLTGTEHADGFTVGAAETRHFTSEADRRIVTPAKLPTDGRYVMVVTKRTVSMLDLKKVVDGDTTPLSPIQAPQASDSSVEFEDENWVGGTWVGGYFLLAARSGQFFHSRVGSSEFNQLEFSHASDKPDGLTAIEAFERKIYLFGDNSVEVWEDAGKIDFTFVRRYDYSLHFGTISPHAVQVMEPIGIIMLGSDGIVYMVSGSVQARISTESMEADIAESDLAQARAFTYVEEGHRFYSLTLFKGSEAVNWTWDQATGLWHERSETTILAQATLRSKSYVGVSGRHAVFRTGIDIGTDITGGAIERKAVSPVYFNLANRTFVRSFLMDIPNNRDNSLTTAQIAEEKVRLEVSTDAKRTWHDMGEKQLDEVRFKWNRIGQFRDGMHLRVTVNARRRVELLGAYALSDKGAD